MQKFKYLSMALLFLPLVPAHAAVSSSSILNLINIERAKAGLSAVTMNTKLSQAAQMKADDMLSQGYFEHIGPDGKDPWSWYAKVGYDWSWAGEILAMNTNTESDTAIIEAWMQSPAHKAIIMDSRYTETGIGMAVGIYQGKSTLFVAEEFGVPKASAIAPESAPTLSPAPVRLAQVPSPSPAPMPITKTNAAVKSVVKSAKNSVVKKVEAKEIAVATTTTSAELVATSTPELPTEPTKVSLLDKVRNFFAYLFTISFGRVG
ncbi:hypothetical protein KW800_00545 [Candidatus Parcubacteria bacterium]|nr:hypothetical protein [Candidatus Parcubacteria bacterium]